MIKDNNPAPAEEPTGRLISVSLAAPGLHVRDFLRFAEGRERFYWERDGVALAGMGTAVELSIWSAADRYKTLREQVKTLFRCAHIPRDVHPLAMPRLFGGFAFQNDFAPDKTWAVFAPAHFILPHYQFASMNGAAWVTINATLMPDQDTREWEAELRLALADRIQQIRASRQAAPTVVPQPVGVNYPMSFDAWEAMVTEATRTIQRGKLKKVVLARAAEVRFDQPVQLDHALDYLAKQYSNSYRFLFEPRPHHVFYGATPELLVKVDGHDVITMGLAGSIRRGKTPEQDAELAAQLLNDPKERYEHKLVVDTIQERLKPLTDTLTVPENPTIYRLSNIQHLYTPIKGTLKNADGVLPLVELLHPTPALGGSPGKAAMQFIREHEPVPRGWYAAPVGWIDHRLDGEFGVAIRSAIAQDRRVWLYAGAGIVGESQPQKEWDETALKFKPMLNALGIGDAL